MNVEDLNSKVAIEIVPNGTKEVSTDIINIDTTEDNSTKVNTEVDPITQVDKLKFAKRILLFGFILLFFCILGLVFLPDNNGIDKVWDFCSVAINSLVAVIIGYYFGSK